jgi:flagellar hook-associated protein 2
MGFTVDGIASGLDTKTLISKLLELERRPVENLQHRVVELQAKQTTFASFQAHVTAIKSAAIDMNPTSMDVPTASVSDDAYLTASLNNSALDGAHSIVVQQLAREHRIGSQGFADADTSPIASDAGTFTVQLGASGAQISIAVNGATTLNDLASAINAEEGDIKASVVNDGTASNAHVLVLTGSEGGTENQIVVASNPTDLNFTTSTIETAVASTNNSGTYTGTLTSGGTFTGATRTSYKIEILTSGAVGEATYRFSADGGISWDDNGGDGYTTATGETALGADGVTTAFSDVGTLTDGDVFYIDTTVPELQSARDAVFNLDGILQTRTSNTITDALEGVTLDLVQADSTKTVTLNVNRVNSTVITKVQALIDSYNGLVSNIRTQQNFDTETYKSGPLFGDGTANRMISMMRTSLFTKAANFDGTLSSLTDLGVTTNSDGTIKLDNTKLTDLLNTRRSEVLEVLGNTHNSSNTKMSVIHRPTAAKAGDYLINVTTPPEKAKIAATNAQTSVLLQAENINFKFSQTASEADPTITNFTVGLALGDGIGDVVNKMNSAFATQNVNLVAFQESGVLKVESTKFGADLSVTMISDQDSGDGTARIGTVSIDDIGVDIVGTIQGQSTTGVAERLQVNATGSHLMDLAVNYTGTTTGNIGTVSLKSGAAKNFNDLVLDFMDGTDSLLKSKDSSLQSSIDKMNKQIVRAEERVLRMQARLQKQFTSLELTMGKLQNQGNFLSNQLTMMQSQTQGIINKK